MNVTDAWGVEKQQSRRHDFAGRNAEKVVVGAVAGHRSMGRVRPGDAAGAGAWLEMPCPDGADAARRDPLRNPGHVVRFRPKGPAIHALLPVAPGAYTHSRRGSSGLLRHEQPACKAVGFPGRLWPFSFRPVERQRSCRHDLRDDAIKLCTPVERQVSAVRATCLGSENRPPNLVRTPKSLPAFGLTHAARFYARLPRSLLGFGPDNGRCSTEIMRKL